MKRRRKPRPRKCLCCRRWFLPQSHNARHQRYCAARRGCRLASRRASQRRYDRRHPDRYRGRADVLRVGNWRADHP